MFTRRQFLLGSAALAGCAAVPAPRRDWFIFLEIGVPTPDDREAVMRMQRGHLDNFTRLFEAGRLQAAGPLRDPAGFKRGIVLVRAASMEELRGYFGADDDVRLGHLALNAVPATTRKPLHTDGIDATTIEEVRIVMVARGADEDRLRGLLRGPLERGSFGAWYSLESGPIAEVLFARTDAPGLDTALAALGPAATVWPQWLGKGVLR
jgi:uncharacterized protein YciI